MARLPKKQGNYEVGNKRPPTQTRFQKGKSGVPGGLPPGTPKISNAYTRLLSRSPEELVIFKPANVAEDLAPKQIQNANSDKPAATLSAVKEITDRTEGRARQRLLVDNTSELEWLIIRVREWVLAQTCIELLYE